MSWDNEWSAGLEDEDEDEQLNGEFYHTRDATIFLLEATPSMLAPTLAPPQPPPPTQATQATQTQTSSSSATTQAAIDSRYGWTNKPATSKLEVCLRAAYAMMRRKVIGAPKDSIGIIIYNTAETKGVSDTKSNNCYLLQDLLQPDAKNIRDLKTLITNCQEDPTFLQTLLRPSGKAESNVADSFGFCNTVFRARSSKLSNKTILLVTDNDDPIGGSDSLQDVARNKRKDLHDSGYGFTPFFIPPSSTSSFDLTKFWGDIVTLGQREGPDDDAEGLDGDTPEWPTVQPDLTAALHIMVTSMRTKEATKRSAFSVPFVLGEGFVIEINGYQLIGEEKKKPPVKVDLNTTTGEEVVSKTFYKDVDNGEPLDPKKDIKKYFQVGKADVNNGVIPTKIFFDEAEVRKIKTLGRSPSLRLIGFKPREEYLRFHETVKHAYFIYPNEETYSGSTRTFASLLQTMLDKDKIGFGVLLPRVSSKPQMVVLIPQPEEMNEYGQQTFPPGIHLSQLPFADDMRPLNIEPRACIIPIPDPEAMDEDEYVRIPEVELAKKIIKGMTKPFDPQAFPNPGLNYFYDTLAALALDEDTNEVVPDDRTIPKYHTIEKRVGGDIRKLRELVDQDEMDASAVQTSNKRRPKDVDPNAPVPDASEFIKDFKSRGSKLLVKDLKEGLKLLGLPTSGRKDELIDRVKEALKKRGGGGSGNDDDASDSDEDVKPQKKKAKSKSSKKTKVVVKNESEEEEDEEPVTEEEEEDVSMGDDLPKPKKEKDRKRRERVHDSMDEDSD
ncbi:hypothetical protein RQP46_004547 [Phenoliferia psychrophenolica]